MECKICFETYNETDRLPKMITNCGHTFCFLCVKKITKCPTCIRQISGTITNYNTLDFINNTAPKTKLDRTLERLSLKNENKDIKRELNLKTKEQLNKKKALIKSLKAEVDKETERKKQILIHSNHKLIDELDRLEAKLDNEILSNQNDIDCEIESIIEKLDDNDLDMVEINKLKKNSIELKSKIKYLESVDLNYSFKTCLYDSSIQIGLIISNQASNLQVYESLTRRPSNRGNGSSSRFEDFVKRRFSSDRKNEENLSNRPKVTDIFQKNSFQLSLLAPESVSPTIDRLRPVLNKPQDCDDNILGHIKISGELQPVYKGIRASNCFYLNSSGARQYLTDYQKLHKLIRKIPETESY